MLCLLLALLLLLSPAEAIGGRYPDKQHVPVDYADMLPVTAFDETNLQSALEELRKLCGRHSPQGTNKETLRRIEFLYDQILSELNMLITKVSLANVQYDASGGAAEEADLYLELSGQHARLFDRCYQVFSDLAASPYREVLDNKAGEGTAQSLLGYQGMTEEEAALWEEEERFIQAYDRIMSQGVPVQVEGEVWTAASLAEAGVDGETAQAVEEALLRERERAAGEIYCQLLQLRTETAAQTGFANYADYAYYALYNRDYDLADAAALRRAVKEYIVPLQLRLLEEIGSQDIRSLDVRSRKTGEEMLDDIQPFIEGFDNEMGKVFAFMREHHLYDIEYDEVKLFTGYTMALPAYGSALIFECPYGDYRDYGDLVHEFGHFNEMYHGTQHDLWSGFSIDVGEIDSQALEMFFTSYAGEIFGGRGGEAYTRVTLYDMLNSVLDGCLYDEFQAMAYQDPDMSVEELNRLFKQMSEEYGYVYDSGMEEDSSWVENSHNFQTPMYFISYATSALSALDLWLRYLEHPRQAKEAYLDLTALSLSLPYREAVEKVGLRDIFASETVPALAEELEARLDGEVLPSADRQGELVTYIFFAAILVIVAFGLWLRVRWARRSRTERRRWEEMEAWSTQRGKPPWEF